MSCSPWQTYSRPKNAHSLCREFAREGIAILSYDFSGYFAKQLSAVGGATNQSSVSPTLFSQARE